MKLVIDIPKTVYKACKEKMDGGNGGLWLESIIAKGTPYEERSKGKWIRDKDGYWVCSVCGTIDASPYAPEPPDMYCHLCGADMRDKEV